MIAPNLLDPGINSAAQNFSPGLTSLIAEGHVLDTTPVYLLLIAAIYLGFHPRHGIRLAVLFGITSGIIEALKLAFHLPRPYWVSHAVKAYAAHSSFGLPSCAAAGSVVMYGYIAMIARRWWIVLICGILFGWTVLARIFAGVHFLLDILGGLLIGMLILILWLHLSPEIESFAGGLSARAQLLGIFLVSLIPLIVVIPAYLSLAGWQAPASWAVTAMEQTGEVISPVQIGYAGTATGILLGSLLGYRSLLMRGGWSPPVGLVRRGVVVVAGMATLLLLDAGTQKILRMPTLLHLLLPPELCDLLSMTLVCFWLTACIPFFAKRAGFAGAGE